MSISFTSSSGCLADRWRMTDLAGAYWSGSLTCTEVITERELAPGESLDEWMGFLGTLEASDYTAGVSFTTTDRTSTTGAAFYGEGRFSVTR
jgi:hypothetical protein